MQPADALVGARHLAQESATNGMLALVRAAAVQNGVPNAADGASGWSSSRLIR